MRIGLACFIGMIAAALLAGCSHGLTVGQGAYRGPLIGVNSSGEWHELIARTPTPGWTFTLDAKRDILDAERVFVTLRRPNPIAAYPSTTVTMHLLTPVRTFVGIEVYARVVPFTGGDDTPYRPVVTPSTEP